MEKDSSIKDIINNSLDQIRTIIDADTVVGKQIVTPSGTVIIPISKISMGFASGGLDLPTDGKKAANFGGGGGTGVTVNPIGFLTVYADGRVEMLPMTQDRATPIEQVADLLDHAPDILNRFKALFAEQDEETEKVDTVKLETEYAQKIQADMVAQSISEKDRKKMQKLEAKAAKKAAKL